ncbi:Uncharacterised protein [Serratia grimesii]|uniref:hypothetical protein n=1 Tax=Serratia grimesii TaxID=82995 RepID=UPI0021C4FCA4|nr:hypothetical protein [Serratia grimesii]CAI2789999.1 Uncharacterised protein [Serratia grimesii]
MTIVSIDTKLANSINIKEIGHDGHANDNKSTINTYLEIKNPEPTTGSEKSKNIETTNITSTTCVSMAKFIPIRDGSIDGFDGLQEALNYSASNNVTIDLPDNFIIRLDKPGIVAPEGAKLAGGYLSNATIIINHSIPNTPQITVIGGLHVFSNISFRYNKQLTAIPENTAPIAFGPTFEGGGYFSHYTNIDFGNSYIAMKLGGDQLGSASKVHIEGCIGAPLFLGLSIERILDVPQIMLCHWNYNYLSSDPIYGYTQSLMNWIHNNGTAYHFGRCDFGTFYGLFSFGYYTHISLRSTRFTGSAENVIFDSCNCDIATIPINAKNWSERLTFNNCKLVGDAIITAGLVGKEPSGSIVSGYQDSTVFFNNCQLSNNSSNALTSSADTFISNCYFLRFGIGSNTGSAKAAISISNNKNLSLENTKIDGMPPIGYSAVGATGILGNTSSGTLNLGFGVQIKNTANEGFRWLPGPTKISNGVQFDKQARTGISFLSRYSSDYHSDVKPSIGNYFNTGDIVHNLRPVKIIMPITDPQTPHYLILGWIRITAVNSDGSNHTLGVDWEELRVLTS